MAREYDARTFQPTAPGAEASFESYDHNYLKAEIARPAPDAWVVRLSFEPNEVATFTLAGFDKLISELQTLRGDLFAAQYSTIKR